MADPCVFSYTNKNGELITFKTKGELAKAFHEGLLDEFIRDGKITSSSTKKLFLKPKEDMPQDVSDKILSDVDNIISKNKDKEPSVVAIKVNEFLRKNKDYNSSSDKSKLDIEKAAMDKVGVPQKKAASRGRLLGALDEFVNISTEDKLGIISRVRELSKNASLEVVKELRELGVSGKISANKVIKIVGMASRVNWLNEKSASSFVDSMSKILSDAEYDKKVDDVKSINSSARKKIKGYRDKELSNMVREFLSIDPNRVSDIDSHLEKANKIKEALTGFTVFKGNLKERHQINKLELSEYIKETKQQIENDIYEAKKTNFEEATGLKSDDLSLDEINKMLFSAEQEVDIAPVRPQIEKSIDSFLSIIDSSVDFASDMFDKSTSEILKKIKGIDRSLLSDKDLLLLVNSLSDIAVNGKSNTIDLFLSRYNGVAKAKEIFDSGLKGHARKLFFSEVIGRTWDENVSSIPQVGDAIFRSYEKSKDFLVSAGFVDIQKGINDSMRDAGDIMHQYALKHLKTKPNGEEFNSEFNKTERTFAGLLGRFRNGNEELDFKNNKSLIEQSIEMLKKGSKSEIKKAAIYEEVYNKLVKDSNNYEDVKSKTDKHNLSAVEDMVKAHESLFEEKSDAVLKYYNTVLEKENGYISRAFAKMEDVEIREEAWSDSYSAPERERVYNKKAGVFNKRMDINRLPENKYIDNNFESFNERALRSGLIDSRTAGHIAAMDAFLSSDSYKKMMPIKEGNLLSNRMKKFVKLHRGADVNFKNVDQKVLNNIIDNVNRNSSVIALGSLKQIPKQTVSVITNTIVNAGGIDLQHALSKDWNDMLNRSGYDISQRGVHSSAEFAKIEKLYETHESSVLGNIGKGAKYLQDIQMKWFLAKPDNYVARASWISYYKKGLKKKGMSTDIDPKTHDIDRDSALYAQEMVDSQQNVSDPMLQGDLFTRKDLMAKFIRTTLFPLSKFGLNQKTRMYNDIIILSGKEATKQDKARAKRSLAGLIVEQLVFRGVSVASSALMSSVYHNIFYDDKMDEEEFDEMLKKKVTSQLRSTVNDFVSPLPATDYPTEFMSYMVSEAIQDQFEISGNDRLDMKPYMSRDYLDKFGSFGIIGKSIETTADVTKMLITEKNDKGRELNANAVNKIRAVSPFVVASQFGLVPVEFREAGMEFVKFAQKETVRKKLDEKSIFGDKPKSIFGNKQESLFNDKSESIFE